MPYGKRLKTLRVAGRVTPEVNQEIDKWAGYLGLQKTAFLSLCIRIGLNGVVRAVSPEKLLETDDWKKIMEIAQVGQEVTKK